MTLDNIADDILAIEGVYRIEHPMYPMRKETVKAMILNHSSVYIRRDLARNARGNAYFYRIEVDMIPVTIGSNVKCLRTKYKIPEPVRLKGDSDFAYVGSVDGLQPFTAMQLYELQDIEGHEISHGFGRYYRKNDYVYILNTTNEAEMIALDAVFIQIVDGTLKVDDVRDFDVTYQFPVPRDVLQIVIKYVTEELKGLKAAPETK